MRTIRIGLMLAFAEILFLLLMFGMAIHLHGQGAGFQLRGPLTFSGFYAGEPVWVVGKGLRITAVDPVLHKHLLELEDQRVMVTIERSPK